MTDWGDLDHELAAWAAAGRRPVFWWRDDDATQARDSLAALLDLRARHGLPLCLAVIPGLIEDSLVERLKGEADLFLLQHGWRHESHAGDGQKKIELGGRASSAEVGAWLAAGKFAGEAAFGDAWLPLLVPPWNRIEARIAGILPDLGFRGLSTHGRLRQPPPAGLKQVNSHLDILRWRPAAAFLGEEPLLALLVAALKLRRLEDRPGEEEPLGILTHHKVQDAASWRFLETLFSRLVMQEVVSWKGAIPLFCEANRGDEE